MNKTAQRLLVFSIGLPSVLSLVFFLPQGHHLAANLTIIAASAIGAAELSGLIGRRGYPLPLWESVLLGAALPAAATLRVSFGVPGDLELYAFAAAGTWILSSRVFTPLRNLGNVMERITASFAALAYPGAFLFWLVRLNADPHATTLLLLFLLMVFGNDSMAWAAGMAFGAGNRGIIPASPNKSAAGFIAGLATSVGLGIAATLVRPAVFASGLLPPVLAGALLGLLCGLATIIGDLAESTMKRSADVKDSGVIIPGRGGLLDSIDSITFAAPIFLAAYVVLFRA